MESCKEAERQIFGVSHKSTIKRNKERAQSFGAFPSAKKPISVAKNGLRIISRSFYLACCLELALDESVHGDFAQLGSKK